MDRTEVHYADIIANDDGDIVQIDRVGPNGEVYFFLILFHDGRGRKITGRRSLAYGNIQDYHHASPEQKQKLKRYVLENT